MIWFSHLLKQVHYNEEKIRVSKQTHFLDLVDALDDFNDDVDNDLEVK